MLFFVVASSHAVNSDDGIIVFNPTLPGDTIPGVATFYHGVKITVEAGSTLWIGGTLDGASFDIIPGAKVKISQKAYTKLLQSESFVIPLGAELEFTYGIIK